MKLARRKCRQAQSEHRAKTSCLTRGRYRLLAVIAAAGALIAFGAASIPPIPDEAYYWAWSRDLSWSYFDHPPAIAAVIAFFTGMFGDGLLGLRAGSVASMAGVLGLSALSARRLSGDPNASWLAMLLLLGAPMFTIGYLPGTHDPVLGFAAALAAYCLIRAGESGGYWSFAAAFVLSAATLIKHSAAIIALGVLMVLIARADGRRLLRAPWPWLGLAAGVLTLFPWLSAELSYGGGSIAFQAAHVFEQRSSRFLISLPLTLGSIALTFGPITAAALLWSCFSDRKSLPRALLSGGAIALLAACVLAVGFGSGEANWPMPALVFALPSVVSLVIERARWRRVAVPASAFTAALLAVYLIHVSKQFLPIPPQRDPALRAAGFDRVAAAVARAAERHQARVIATRRYQNASLLRYHLRDRWQVLELGSPNGRKSQYDRWRRPEIRQGEVVIVVGEDVVIGGAVIDRLEVDRWTVRAVRTATRSGGSA